MCILIKDNIIFIGLVNHTLYRVIYDLLCKPRLDPNDVAFVGVATWFRDGSATHPSAARVISTQTPMWWMANGVY